MNPCGLILDEYKRSGEGTVIVVCGPTASGKSAVAMEFCEKTGGEIVSCDSMQIYRMMDIGTAKPTPEERMRVRHHLIDIADPWENYSSYLFKEAAVSAIGDVLSRGRVPVVCGGTGLYVNSLLDNRRYTELGGNGFYSEEYRRVYDEALACNDQNDLNGTHALLVKYDPEAAALIHKNNAKRVFRFLELYLRTGKTLAERNAESLTEPPSFKSVTFCLFPGRIDLYERIDRRVDTMREKGLFGEALNVYRACRENICEERVSNLDILKLTALSAIGYKELIPYFDFGELEALKDGLPPVDSAFELIKKNTRRFAKRQITWFKRTPGARYITV